MLAVGVVASAVPGVSAAGDPVAACQQAIGKAGGALVDAVLRAEQACLQALAQGKLGPEVRCTDRGPSTGAITDERTLARVRGAIEKAGAAIARRCAVVDVAAPPPAGLGMPAACPWAGQSCVMRITDVSSLADCLVCAHVDAAQALVAGEYSPSLRGVP